MALRGWKIAAASLVLAAGPALFGQRPNVILISLDQIQADRLHSYGNRRPTSPNLDRLAAEGTRFTRFYSSAPWTASSYGAMMTSQYPSRHGVTLLGVPGLRPGAITLAEVFRKAGYQTAAFVNNSVAGASLTARGFDHYDEAQRRAVSITEREFLKDPEFKAPAINQRVMRWLEQHDSRPFFLFFLYFEPHSPYDPPPEHDLFKTGAYPNESHEGYDRISGRLSRWANLGDRRAVERLVQLYDGKIHFVDHYVGQLMDWLRRREWSKNTVILLTSDHGELLFSHPEDYLTADHRSLYDPVMHVPAILWGAGVPAGKTIDALASHIDIAPTLLELAGLPPKPDAQGASLVPLLRGKARKVHKYVFGEQDIMEELRSVRDERYKLILQVASGRKMLFDMRKDPGERHNLADVDKNTAARLSAALDEWRGQNEPDPAGRERRSREISAKSRAVRVVDEVTVGAHLQLNGTGWRMSDDGRNLNGGCYWSEPGKPGQPPLAAVWRTDNPLLGRYRISMYYGGIPEGGVATDTPVVIATRRGDRSFRVDQTRGTSAWKELGVFEDPLFVKLTNEATGRVIVDAVRFERLD